MKTQVSELIELLYPKECPEYMFCEEWSTEEGCHVEHPILIGDVLQKMDELEIVLPGKEAVHVLCFYWQKCGFTKSLQEIVAAAGWDMETGELHYPDAKSLVSFLVSIFLSDK